MRLRPEQWVLLAVLTVGLGLLVLQLGQKWSVPDFDPPAESPTGASAGGAGPETPPGDAAGAAPPAESGPPPGVEAGTPAAASSGQPAPAAPPAAGAPALALRLEPATIRAPEPFTVVVSLEGAARAVKVVFEIAYNPEELRPDADVFGPMVALGDEAYPALVTVETPQAGRLRVLVSRRGGDPSINASGDLCAIQFLPVGRGTLALKIDRAEVHESDTSRVAARGSEARVTVL